MSEPLDKEPRELPPSVTFGEKLGQVIAAKLRDGVADMPLTDGQKEFVANAGWFETDTRIPLPLLEADSFRISFVARQDTVDTVEPAAETVEDFNHLRVPGNYALSVHLFRDGSPFAYDEDPTEPPVEYVILAGQDMPPTAVHESYLEDAAVSSGRILNYGHGNWSDLSGAIHALSKNAVHLLSDQDCENLLQGVAATQADVAQTADEMRRLAGFSEL